jgi:L-2-hydroxyglutarate oxidase LhgO
VSSPAEYYEFAVIGAGILGLATARELHRRHPSARIVILEKEKGPAEHQSGHNSGVIHSGLYYLPGSAKARLCVEGRRLLLDLCEERGITVDLCGKLVVASDEAELPRLNGLRERGTANGLKGLELLDERGIAEKEPAVRGHRALWVPEAGIVDYTRVALSLEEDLRSAGVSFRYGFAVRDLELKADSVILRTERASIVAEYAIGCAGLHSDRIARMAGAAATPRIVPFRGDYYLLHPARRSLVRGLVYPVPDPRFPFLGVHFTRRIDGAVWLGPNAVLAFAREGYRRSDVDVSDLAESLGYIGFRRLATRHWRTGVSELIGDYWKPAFLSALQKYMPTLTSADLLPGPSGVRAQALDTEGRLVDDFIYDTAGRFLNVRNAPSPAATSSLALAREFVDRIACAA